MSAPTPSSSAVSSRESGAGSFFGRFVRHPWWTLAVWTLVLAAVHITSHGASWHYLETGVRALFSHHPLALFALHPELQMGPLTFVLGAPFVDVLHGIVGEVAVMVLMLAIGLLTVREIRLLAAERMNAAQWLIASLLVMAAWTELAVRWGHLDDAMALYLGVLGLRRVREGRIFIAAVFLALAVDFKPWALPFVAFLLLAPARRWIPLAAIWVVIVGAVWAPFVLGDPDTLRALRYGIPIDPASTLHLFYLHGGLTPSWDRYAQFGIGFVLAAVAIWRKRWASAFLIVIVVRLLLDPGTKNYYDAGLLVAVAIFDVLTSTTSIPWATIFAVVLVYLPSYYLVDVPLARGIVRTVALVALLVAAFFLPRARQRTAVIPEGLSPSATATR